MNTDPSAVSSDAIELDKAYVFRHWMRQLDASAEDLEAAVLAVGPYESRLRDYFRRHALRID
jgi:hypothetical protein